MHGFYVIILEESLCARISTSKINLLDGERERGALASLIHTPGSWVWIRQKLGARCALQVPRVGSWGSCVRTTTCYCSRHGSPRANKCSNTGCYAWCRNIFAATPAMYFQLFWTKNKHFLIGTTFLKYPYNTFVFSIKQSPTVLNRQDFKKTKLLETRF